MADRGGYIGRNPGDSAVTLARQNYSPTGVQTNFSFSATYIPGLIDAYINGVRLVDNLDYTASDGATVGLVTAAQSGDVVELIAYKAFNVAAVTNATGNFNVGQNLSVGGDITVTGTYNIGIQSAGITKATEIKTLNFVGAGNTFLDQGNGVVDISISGGGGGASKVYDSTIFGYQNVIQSDINIESPNKTAVVYTNDLVTVDIESGSTVTVDEGCVFDLVDI